jgi:MoaA/NifB/PqqE/SkfB family radical SAM enzyme
LYRAVQTPTGPPGTQGIAAGTREGVVLDGEIRSLPLLTLYLTERCNSRCVSCDYWRHGRADISTDSVARLLPDLAQLGTRLILISGGEPLIHPQWVEIAQLLKDNGLDLWLLTSGLSLAKHAARAATLFESVTVSLDGTDPAMYAAIRGLDAFGKVCEGIRAAADAGLHVGVRVTVQRRNYRHLADFVELAHEHGASQISFLAADVSSAHAFGRNGAAEDQIALAQDDLAPFAATLDALERERQADFASGFIAESPAKLRRLQQYYAALHGAARFPATRCNAPEFSAVMDAGGGIQPCFFIQGPAAQDRRLRLDELLNDEPMRQLRADIRIGRRAECERCVCSMWRDLEAVTH